ncbi:hypothetical protein ZWY2020_007820 [Hordeum vulgare]|nr:hypothetical protein ZWY2020_007820 [Hordeum vulgare]
MEKKHKGQQRRVSKKCDETYATRSLLPFPPVSPIPFQPLLSLSSFAKEQGEKRKGFIMRRATATRRS